MKKEIYLKLALFFNQELFYDNKIPYQMYKNAEDNLLKSLNS